VTESIFDQFRRAWGDPQEALERLRRGERNTNYALDHLEAWRLQYPDSWIGVYNEQLVAVDKDADRLIAKLESKSVPLREAFVRFIPKEKYSLVL
jgi:hypothetical protein